ncbi:MAG: response regulator transcription factor [Anaerolineae bacterium]|jgi:NarL family two-component system response regulator LiaR
MNPTRLLIIDDHEDVRWALKTRLDAAPEIEVVGCTGCWETGVQEALEQEPDVVLLETKRTDGQGLEALQRLTQQCSCAQVLVLTSYLDAGERESARSEGAARCLLKDIDTETLVEEIQSAAR